MGRTRATTTRRGIVANAATPSPAPRSTSYWLIIFAAVLITVTFLVYQPAWNGKPLLDDNDHMANTPQLRSFQGLSDLWFAPHTTRQYHPLLDTVYWLEDKLWGQSVLGYHLLSIAMHAVSALLLFAILRRLKIPGAWLAAAVFALHPVHVESVAWMVELKNTLSGSFFFAALLAYLQFDEKRTAKWYTLVVVLFTMGVLVKAIVATLPAVVLLIFWWQRGKLEWKRDVRPLIPFLVLGVAAGIFTAWMERALSGAEGEEFEFSAFDRILIAGRAFWFYIGKLFWPTRLSLIYPRWKIDSAVWWQYLFPLSTLCLAVLLWMLRQRWRGLFASFVFFVVLVAPFLGFFNVNFFRFSFVADHFQYLPSLAVITPAAAGAALCARRVKGWERLMAYLLCAVLLAVLAKMSWQQAHAYRDADTCYRSVIEKNPTSWEAHLNIGAELFKKGALDEAIFHFRRILELRPDYPLAAKRAYIGLGNTFLKRGQWDEAIAYIRKSLQVDPNYAPAHAALGSALHRIGKLRESIEQNEIALRIRPKSASFQSNLAWILATCSDPFLRDGPRALALAQQADHLTGGANSKILRSLAAAYAENARFTEASETARRALQLTLHDQGPSPFSEALHDEIGRYERAEAYHEVAE